jgi:hypothetical protein
MVLLLSSVDLGKAQETPALELSINYSHVGVTSTNAGLGSFSMNGASGQVAYNFTKWISGVADVGYYAIGQQQFATTDNCWCWLYLY